jgi:hypothetical protein
MKVPSIGKYNPKFSVIEERVRGGSLMVNKKLS